MIEADVFITIKNNLSHLIRMDVFNYGYSGGVILTVNKIFVYNLHVIANLTTS